MEDFGGFVSMLREARCAHQDRRTHHLRSRESLREVPFVEEGAHHRVGRHREQAAKAARLKLRFFRAEVFSVQLRSLAPACQPFGLFGFAFQLAPRLRRPVQDQGFGFGQKPFQELKIVQLGKCGGVRASAGQEAGKRVCVAHLHQPAVAPAAQVPMEEAVQGRFFFGLLPSGGGGSSRPISSAFSARHFTFAHSGFRLSLQ
jgi:hypothetical protein